MERKTRLKIALVIGVAWLLVAVPILGVCAGTSTAAQPIKLIRLYTTSFGTMGYILGFAVKDILEKQHPWLRAEVVETLSSTEAAAIIAGSSELKTAAITSGGSDKIDSLKKGEPPLKKPITDGKKVGVRLAILQFRKLLPIIP